MSVDELFHSIDAMHRRVTALSDHVDRATSVADAPGQVDELRTALEELRVAEEELREQADQLVATRAAVESERHRYQTLFEFAPDGYLVTDGAGIVQEANYAAAHLLGIDVVRLPGKPLAVFVAVEDRLRFRDWLAHLTADGLSRSWQMRLLTRQHRVVDAAVTVASVADEPQGQPIVRWLLRDIGDIKRAEAEIRTLNADLEQRVAERTAQLESANQAKDELLKREQAARAQAEAAQQHLAFLAAASETLGASLDETTILTNLAHMCVPALADYCLVFGAADQWQRPAVAHADPSQEALVRRLAELATDSIDAETAHPLLRVLHDGGPSPEPTESDLWLVTGARDAAAMSLFRQLGCVSYMVVPLVARGRTLGALALVMAGSGRRMAPTDLTMGDEIARRAATAVDNAQLFHETETALQARDAFLAAVSHDLRTPLTGVRGMVQLLQRRIRRGAPYDDRAINHSLALIDESAGRMATMIEELVDVGHMQAGKPLLLNRQPTDLIALAQKIVEQHQRTTTRHVLRLRTEESTIVGQWDAARLARVLDNLLANAVKYSPSGGAITVTAAIKRDGSADSARLAVADEGVGIPAADLPHLFERFHRASNVVGRFSGSGIGLATVYHLVDQHGGTVSIDSDVGRGTTVTVCLPLEPPRP